MTKKDSLQKGFWQQHKQNIAIGFFIVTGATLMFGLGYMVALEKDRAPIIIEKYSE